MAVEALTSVSWITGLIRISNDCIFIIDIVPKKEEKKRNLEKNLNLSYLQRKSIFNVSRFCD